MGKALDSSARQIGGSAFDRVHHIIRREDKKGGMSKGHVAQTLKRPDRGNSDRRSHWFIMGQSRQGARFSRNQGLGNRP